MILKWLEWLLQLLLLLAVLSCHSSGWLQDTTTCRKEDVNSGFVGKVDHCSSGKLRHNNMDDCKTTAAGINDHPDYDGPDIGCVYMAELQCGGMGYNGVYNPGYLLLQSQAQCEAVAEALNGLDGVSNVQCGGAWLGDRPLSGLWLSSQDQCTSVAKALGRLDGVSAMQCGHNNYLKIVQDCEKYATILAAHLQPVVGGHSNPWRWLKFDNKAACDAGAPKIEAIIQCASKDCGNGNCNRNGICVSTPGWGGADCKTPNDCAGQDCSNGSCKDLLNDYKCECNA